MQGSSRDSLAALREALAAETAGVDAATLHQLSDELFAVTALVAGSGPLRRAISDPGLRAEDKVRVVDSLLTGKVTPGTVALVRLAAGRRWSESRDVVDSLETLAVDAALTGAERSGQLDEVEDQLFRFERIVDGEPALRVALTDRYLPAERKRDLVRRLLDGKVAPVTVALVRQGVLHPRGRTIERVLEEFTSVAAQRRSRLVARVVTATALTADQQTRLADALAREFGHEVRLQVVVDPSILGGMTVRIGDELIDASVLRKLNAARRHLAGRPGRV